MGKEQVPIEVYKKLICDMVQGLSDERFIKQIYSIIFTQIKRTGS